MQTADDGFRIDGYKFLPRSMIPEFKALPYQADDVVKAAPAVSVKNARVALLTSSGLYLKDSHRLTWIVSAANRFGETRPIELFRAMLVGMRYRSRIFI